MREELKRDIVDGRIIDWSKLSVEELKKMKKEYKEKEEELLKKIDEQLKEENNQ